MDYDQTSVKSRSVYSLLKMKKKGYRARIFETGVSVNHAFNIFEEFKMCHILSSNSTYYPNYFSIYFLEEFYTMYVI